MRYTNMQVISTQRAKPFVYDITNNKYERKMKSKD